VVCGSTAPPCRSALPGQRALTVSGDHQAGWGAIVVGGAPAGSAMAAGLAMRGHRVLVLDREHFPRPKLRRVDQRMPSTAERRFGPVFRCSTSFAQAPVRHAAYRRAISRARRWRSPPGWSWARLDYLCGRAPASTAATQAAAAEDRADRACTKPSMTSRGTHNSSFAGTHTSELPRSVQGC
jgi:hypothetical protein